MDLKTTREAVITSDVLTAEDKKRISDFLKPYASKLKIDFKKDVSISIRTKHNEDGANLLIKFKDVEVKDVDVAQMNLFTTNGTDKTNDKTAGKESKGIDIGGKIVDM